MIYLNSDIINKIGNSNRLYYNGSIVYQGYTTGGDAPDIPDGDYSLPDVPFMFNYNAKQYSNGVIPNAAGALFEYDCTLSKTSVVDYYGDYLTFNADGNFSLNYSSSSNNPFNRSGNQPMTIIMKTRTVNNGGDNHPLANRGTDFSYNWMCRIGNGYQWLHTNNSYYSNAISVPYVYGVENIVAYRCLDNGNGYAQNYTTGVIGETKNTNWGSKTNTINFFDGGFSGEIFLGDFYWMYCSLEQLTDEQIQQVIEYNENKAFEPVVPPVEPEPDEPETPEIPEGVVSLQYCWDNSIFNVPFRECYIDMNNVEDDLPTNYFICLSKTPDTQNASTTTYSMCPKENSIFDTGNSAGWRMYIMEGFYNSFYNGTPVVATPLGNGIYYYQFSTPVYLSYKPNEANAPFWRVNVVPINN